MLKFLIQCKLINYDLNTLKDEVISAEIVEVTRPNGKLEIKTYNLISDENFTNILSDLFKIEFVVTLGRPQLANGTCIKLNYENEYELICKDILIKYNYNHDHISHKDIYNPKGFDEFISKYKLE